MKLLESQIGKINIFAGQLFATKAFSNNIIRSTSNVYFQCKIHAYFYFYFSRNMLSISKYLGYLLYLFVGEWGGREWWVLSTNYKVSRFCAHSLKLQEQSKPYYFQCKIFLGFRKNMAPPQSSLIRPFQKHNQPALRLNTTSNK